MWACIKECVSAAFPRLGWIAVLGIVAGILALVTGSIMTGGAASAPLAIGLASVLKVAGVVIAGDLIGGLLGCIAGCLFV